jgi:hypothetical protein
MAFLWNYGTFLTGPQPIFYTPTFSHSMATTKRLITILVLLSVIAVCQFYCIKFTPVTESAHLSHKESFASRSEFYRSTWSTMISRTIVSLGLHRVRQLPNLS